MINDVLDISKIEAGQLDVAVERCDLHAMVDALVSSLEPQATEKGVKLLLVTEDRLVPDVLVEEP